MKANSEKDQELVHKFMEGDQASIEVLINRHKNRIYTYILLIVREQQLAEDIFQDTFIKVIRSLRSGRYQEKGVFVSWVIRIAHNLIIDFYRKEKYLKTYSNDASEVDILNSRKFSEMNIEDELIKEQISHDVRKLIEQLPENQKQVILLRHYGRLSFKEVAKQTNVSINTSLGRMRYALINLRKLIENNKLSLTK